MNICSLNNLYSKFVLDARGNFRLNFRALNRESRLHRGQPIRIMRAAALQD